MTDNEIIKALECCARPVHCRDCPYMGHNPCRGELITDTFNLVNRQKAEISVKRKLLCNAEAKIKALEMDNAQLNSDIINATQNLDHMVGLLAAEKEKVKKAKQKVIGAFRILKTAKTEAIKEFAERLKKKKCHYSETEYTFDFDGVTVEDIDAIAKEMTEEHYETQ